MKETCNSSGECLHHVPDGDNTSFGKIIIGASQFSEVGNC